MLANTNQAQVGFRFPCTINIWHNQYLYPLLLNISVLLLKSKPFCIFPPILPYKTFQESAYDVTIEDLFNATVKLEEKEKVYSNAEGEVNQFENFFTSKLS